MPILAPVPVQALALVQAFAGLVGMALTMSRVTVIKINKIPDHIRITTPDPNDRVTSSLVGGIALYEAFLHAGLWLPFHLFILTLLD